MSPSSKRNRGIRGAEDPRVTGRRETRGSGRGGLESLTETGSLEVVLPLYPDNQCKTGRERLRGKDKMHYQFVPGSSLGSRGGHCTRLVSGKIQNQG